MSWYQPLLDKLQQHLIDHHGHDTDAWTLHEEMNFMEEHLYFEKFAFGTFEWISCPFVGCKWCTKFTINYDLLIAGEEE